MAAVLSLSAPAAHSQTPVVLMLPHVRHGLAARFDSTQVSLESEEDALCLTAREVPMPQGYRMFIVTAWQPAVIEGYTRDTTAGRRSIGLFYNCPRGMYFLHTHSEAHARWIAPERTDNWYHYPSLMDVMTAIRRRESLAIVQWARDGFTAYSNTHWPGMGDKNGEG